MSFVPGCLVEIQGLKELAKPVDGCTDVSCGPTDLNGVRAQLVEYNRESSKWIAATFVGQMITIEAKYLRLLGADELKGYDIVMGPGSKTDIMGEEIANSLCEKGYAVMKVFVAEEDSRDMISTAERLEDDDQFSRLAVEFERGYLGADGSAKVVHVDCASRETPDYVKDSPLSVMDGNFNAISSMLAPFSQSLLGFDIFSRSTMLLRMPLADGDEDKYPPAEVEDGDAESYMHLMYRKRLTLLQFVGPAAGTLKLTPKRQGGSEIVLKAEPGTLMCILEGAYEYTYVSDGKSLALSAFYLDEPPTFQMGEYTGDLESLGVLSSGPPAPPGAQVVVDAMYCRYGMGSDGRKQFWSGVKSATDGLLDIPFTRYDHAPYYDPDSAFGGSYTRHGCFGIEGVDLFDCKFFEISPSEAKGMDPCQRQVLEVSYMALREGGWDKKKLQRESANVGHFVGIDKDDWMCMSASGMLNLSGAHGAAAAANAITANRFSYSLNLKGASMQIDTACSSSLVCMHVSKLHLRFKDFDPMPAAIINGLNLMLFPGPFVGCCAANMLSHEGRCFTFNATADGYARGEACGAICTKVHQFDPEISYASLAGTQANQDGRSASLTAPNGPAQERCLNAVLREVHLTPTEVDCFECHGTGTSLGDPIEVGSFRKVMSQTARLQPLVITSSKSNIAHAEGGAGMAGFFKCVLQVANCEACSNVHLRVKNPHLDLDGFPCQVLGEVATMRDDSSYCGVSSFGFGGTNAHAEAWGKNIFTSRGSLAINPQKAFEKKLAMAPAAEITMNGDDVRDWETTGLDPAADKNSEYTIALDEDGIATWEKKEDDFTDYGNEFFVQGSHNNWSPDGMDRHDVIPGLWTGTVEIGANGEEEFQVIADSDAAMVYCPISERCSLKAAPIQGPGEANKSLAWLIKGSPGDIFRVEFFQQDKKKSILWLKQ